MLPPENLGMECSGELTFPPEVMDIPSTPEVVYTDVLVVPEHYKEGLESTISSLQGEVLALRLKQKSLDAQRKEALNKILDIKGSIRVFCRVRFSLSDDKRKQQSSVSINKEQITIRSGGTRKEFVADRLFTQEATQVEVFHEVEPILRSALDGHNVCIFAYGQTGTGKTFTMEGTIDQPGIVPRSIKELFHQASEDKSASFTFSMSMLEVYMGNLRDLLAHKQSSSRATKHSPKCGLNILSDSNGSVEIEGLTDIPIADFKEAYRWYAKGKRARSTSWTSVNETSSRSHCLTRITILRSGYMEESNRAVAKLWMVDLGGSERLLKTGATGKTLDEGKAINLSLSALADVIASLKKKRNHIPYRNSKLTQILSDSLGDGSKVLMIVHISPGEDDIGETICSLSFAKRVRAIEPSRELSEDLKKQKEKRIIDLNQQIEDVEMELDKVKSHIETAEKLIQEKKQLHPIQQLLEDQKGSPRSPLIIYHGEPTETPETSEKFVGRAQPSSVPRFMTSTICSRRRLSASREVHERSKTMRMVNKRPVELIGSHSHTYSENSFKPNPQRLKTCNSINAKMSSLSRDMKVFTSHPASRVTLHNDRRRMSNLT